MWQPHACHMCILSHAGTCKQPPSCHRGHEHSPHVTNGRPRSSREQEEAVRQSQEGQLASGLGLVGISPRVSHWIRQHTAFLHCCLQILSKLGQGAVLQSGQMFLSITERCVNLLTCSQKHPCYQFTVCQ